MAQFQTTSRDPSPENRPIYDGFRFKSVRFKESRLYKAKPNATSVQKRWESADMIRRTFFTVAKENNGLANPDGSSI